MATEHTMEFETVGPGYWSRPPGPEVPLSEGPIVFPRGCLRQFFDVPSQPGRCIRLRVRKTPTRWTQKVRIRVKGRSCVYIEMVEVPTAPRYYGNRRLAGFWNSWPGDTAYIECEYWDE